MSEIPDKEYFKIGEVSRILKVKSHVLRYWETEFKQLKPQKTRSNQRLYSRRDVELLLLIKQLLYKEGFTIVGANKYLSGIKRIKEPAVKVDPSPTFAQIRKQVEEILALVED
ncbi:MAG: MerR family transcriptional regulator [Pseudomonadota bacterium]